MNPARHPVILTYHSVSAGCSPLKISASLFTEQMEWLKSHARVVSLGQVVDALTTHQPLLERAVALTFDDGFQDFFTAAAPVLRRMGFPATVFLATAWVGRSNAWPGQPEWVEEQPLMNWEQVRELAQQGITFGSHSVSHPVLTGIPPAEAEREMTASKQEIEQHTGQGVSFFCYPYGRWNDSVRQMVKRNYRGACSTAAGVVEPHADPLALPRVDAHYVRSPRWFASMFTRRFVTYIATRRLIRRLRGQPEGFYAKS